MTTKYFLNGSGRILNPPSVYAYVSGTSTFPFSSTYCRTLNAQHNFAMVIKTEFVARCSPGQIRRPQPKEGDVLSAGKGFASAYSGAPRKRRGSKVCGFG